MEKTLENTYLDLLAKYDYDAFMYTEYPHKSFWSKDFNEKDYLAGLNKLLSNKKDVPLMLYIHIPFCPARCFYCTCHTIVTKDYGRIKDYLKSLFLEIDLLRGYLNMNSIIPNFQEIHLGGGSPTFLREKEFDQLIAKINTIADIRDLSEFSIEIDPRYVDKEKMRYYRTKGINRISFGVQDFDPSVQKAINRIQPPELIEDLLVPELRRCFDHGVNFDILCGLPNQTKDSIRRTFKRIVKMSPDRICFNYLHYSPKFARHQLLMHDGRHGRPDKLPDLYEKKILFCEALNILEDNGYLRTGYDHFALPDDDVAKSMQTGTMRWNALGTTSGRYLATIGLGLHSYSTLGDYYSQNVHEVANYQKAVENGKFPIYRGHKMKADDLIRRDTIQALRNYFFLDYRSVENKYHIKFREYFKKELGVLEEFAKDGLINISTDFIAVTKLGQQFSKLVCRVFDCYIGA